MNSIVIKTNCGRIAMDKATALNKAFTCCRTKSSSETSSASTLLDAADCNPFGVLPLLLLPAGCAIACEGDVDGLEAAVCMKREAGGGRGGEERRS